ncbi:hemolysin D [Shewanella surugensis]|uniref:Hemolysin D n=1 Tax=Shewanella surugensis TaxID=212020 RepID=A0ABT0LFZ2_9GAMM|nr:hemolysin D [Shewanella surugensis]MCL1126616.1 hemolysin D [Shewanella surugensis]
MKLALKITCPLLISIQSLFPAQAFTQSGATIDFIGSGIPMGHEWLTRMSAFEVIGNDPVISYDPDDPRSSWSAGLARNTQLDSNALDEVNSLIGATLSDTRYESTYQFIHSAILGQRWVDLGGFNVTSSSLTSVNCFDVVSQEPAELQKDHYMRRYDDLGNQGGIDAATRSQTRFIQHFIDAAMATDQQIKMWDGGAYSAQENVNYQYFLFGRAIHLFQDSFSPEHTVRLSNDNYETVYQVKSYLCAEGSEQHTHDTKEVLDYSSDDVIWNEGSRLDSGWESYKASNMKDVALVATEASKDLWAAFFRTMGTPIGEREAVALVEAQTLVDNWLAIDTFSALSWYDETDHQDSTYVAMLDDLNPHYTQEQCMVDIGVDSGSQQDKVEQLEDDRLTCMYNIEAESGYEDVNDPHMDIPYNWKWKNATTWLSPDADWIPEEKEADLGTLINIISAVNNEAMTLSSGELENNTTIYVEEGTPLALIQVEMTDDNAAYFRVKDNADLFLSYATFSGKVKLADTPRNASYEIQTNFGESKLLNQRWNDYLWFYERNGTAYVSGDASESDIESSWYIQNISVN